MSGGTPKVLASILNFNSGGQVLATIASFQGQTCPGLDLVVFDNASSDGSREAVQAAFPALAVINTGSNLGYCGGNNAALEYGLARGYDAVVVANHDIELKPDAIERMMRVAALPDAGVVGAQEVDAATGENRVFGGKPYDFWRSRRRWMKDPGEMQAAPGPVAVDYVQGALVLVTRRALDRGIRFNADMFAYADEIELGLQLKTAGLRAYVDPAVAVSHRSRGIRYGAVEGYLMQRNRWYLVRRHGTPAQRAVNFALTALIELPIKSALRTIQGHPRYAGACILGFVDGVRGRMGIGRVPGLTGKA